MNVGILGATGAVGQKFIRLLTKHPWFTITALGASQRSAGKPYSEVVNWIEDVPISDKVAHLTVKECTPEALGSVDFVFSGLASNVASDIEACFAKASIPVISNAKNYRQDPTVPLLIPEVNPDHISLISSQGFSQDGSGWIITNPNCVAVPLSLALKPLHDRFGLKKLSLTTLQALSGAGYPGAVLSILGASKTFLIETNKKKCNFLITLKKETNSNFNIVNSRIENLKFLNPSLIVSRALTSTKNLLRFSIDHMQKSKNIKSKNEALKNVPNLLFLQGIP